MCRLYGFRATDPTRVECSLVLAQNALLSQSRLDQRGMANGDGWGIAHYQNAEPTVHKRARAADQDLSFANIAERVSAETVLAHVRAATVGATSIDNTHPFHHGPWTFAHNGTVTGFDKVQPRLSAATEPQLRQSGGSATDSEAVFRWLLSRMPERGLHPRAPAHSTEALSDLLGDAVVRIAAMSQASGVAEPPKLNLMLTDGAHMAVSRWGNTLHYVERHGITDCALCSLNHAPGRQDAYRAVVVASEPITDEDWQEVPEGSVLTVDREVRVHLLDLLVPERAVL